MLSTCKKIFTGLIEVVFPRTCAGCKKPQTLLCGSCINKIPQAPPSKHTWVRSIFDYRDPTIKNLVWRFKYRHERSVAEVFAPYAYDEVIGMICDSMHLYSAEKILLIPIPLHKKRLRERGYNQSDLLVRAITKLDSACIFEHAPNILARTRATKPQARNEKRLARLENLRDAFTCLDETLVRGRTVILVDDVTTTGATLMEARRALSAGKPRKVLGVTVAH